MENIETPSKWKTIQSFKQASYLVDHGVLLCWKEARLIKKALPSDDKKHLLRYIAKRLADPVAHRLSNEVLFESLLVLLAINPEENGGDTFLKELFQQPNREEAFYRIINIALTADFTTQDTQTELFSVAVSLACDLGIAIHGTSQEFPDEIPRSQRILDHLATHLLSVSNRSSNCIRLSLLKYFGETEKNLPYRPAFNRILSRFGHTILQHLFNLLFSKKTEAIALQYLLENIPHILEADNQAQKILYETWKFHMLKKPERFSLFLQIMSEQIKAKHLGPIRTCAKVFVQHLAILLKVSADINHRNLGKEIMCAMITLKSEYYSMEMMQQILKDESFRDSFRQLLNNLVQGAHTAQIIDDNIGFRSSKRGRKPSFTQVQHLGSLHQVTFLGQKIIGRAS